jgi:hypothetical protein
LGIYRAIRKDWFKKPNITERIIKSREGRVNFIAGQKEKKYIKLSSKGLPVTLRLLWLSTTRTSIVMMRMK